MFDPQKLLPIVQSSFPKAKPEQLMAALTNLAKAHPDLSAAQALAALQKFMQQKQSPIHQYLANGGFVTAGIDGVDSNPNPPQVEPEDGTAGVNGKKARGGK